MPTAIAERIITEIPAAPIHIEKDIRKRSLRVAAYCRVSTDSEEQLNSYESQITYYTDMISQNPNWRMAGIFPDKGLSGTSTKKREQFNKMMQKCRRGSIDLIICKSVSRFARNTLDSLGHVRKLKAMGVGVIFEKEGVNTLEMDDETLLTIFSVLAQAESQSLSKNVAMGFRQAFKAGKVPFHNILGYKKATDGAIEIVPEGAKVVRRIYHRYLSGQSTSQIKVGLEADGILSPRGKAEWSEATVQNILRNERYVGDALLQKTYVTDCLTHRSVKNNGEHPQYYIRNNHPPIIERDIWNKTQEEIARRTCKRKAPSKSARTEVSKYSGKYALNEVLICGECGTPYRRVTWTKNQRKTIVWRCISRLEHGKTRCSKSPSIPEEALHQAIMEAVSESILRAPLLDALTESVRAAAGANSAAAEYHAAKLRVAKLDEMSDEIIKQSADAGDDDDFYDNKFVEIMAERAKWQEIARKLEAQGSVDRYTEQQIAEAVALLAQEPLLLTEYSDEIVRQLVDTIRVMSKHRIIVTLKGGMEIDQLLHE